MTDLLPLAIGVGLAVSLVFSEAFALAAGGMVVPGYMALHLLRPGDVALTLAASLATFALVRAVSSFTIVYGRRRTVLMILVGYLVGMLARSLGHQVPIEAGPSYDVIGYIVPGLIAIWLDRQGVVQTFCSLATVSVVVRLILILAVGEALLTP
jgi:poly-gamma-glutamate biosynthesis protein PgsC/CapC